MRVIYECQCDERLKAKAEGSTRLAYTGLKPGILTVRRLDQHQKMFLSEERGRGRAVIVCLFATGLKKAKACYCCCLFAAE